MHLIDSVPVSRGRFFGGLLLSAVLVLSGAFLTAPSQAHALTTSSICPSQASVKSSATWQNILGTYNTTGFSNEIGTLAGCAAAVSVVNLPAVDYYVYFDAASVGGLDLFGGGSVLSFSVTGAPGAAGWYVQAFDSIGGTRLTTKNYGGGGADGRFNYSPQPPATATSLVLPDGTVTTQPFLDSGDAGNPSPSYTVTYGFTPDATQRTNIEAGGLAIYIGYLGSTNATARDTLNSVRLIHYLADEAPAETVRPAVPSIGLAVEASVGSPANGRTVDYVGYRMRPGSTYSLVLEPGSRVLATGTVPSSGDVAGRPVLADLGPGTYSVRLSAVGEDGNRYQLTQSFVVGADLRVESIASPAGSISAGSADGLARTGVDGLQPLLWASVLGTVGVAFLVLRRHRLGPRGEG